MNELIAVVTITVLAVISPGADFAMVTRNSYLYGRWSGLYSAAGISFGVLIHVSYTLLGVGLLVAHSSIFLILIKVLGAGYLVYVGITTFKTRAGNAIEESEQKQGFGQWQSFRMGIFTNALNPKTMLFVVSLYSQLVSQNAQYPTLFGIGLFIALAHLCWFFLVAVFFSNKHLRNKMLNNQVTINKCIGSVLIVLGALLLVPVNTTDFMLP